MQFFFEAVFFFLNAVFSEYSFSEYSFSEYRFFCSFSFLEPPVMFFAVTCL